MTASSENVLPSKLADHTLPASRYLVYAISELGSGRLEQARIYVDENNALRRSGVPPKFCRELLGEQLPDVEATQIVREWSGPRGRPSGQLVLVGPYGTAKSYALARWALQRHRAGLLTRWESVATWGGLRDDELRARTCELLEHDALILDDIGAGSLTQWHRDIVEATLVERHALERPTAIAMNAASVAEAMDTIGHRACDRIVNEGGTLRQLRATTSMRRPPPDDLDGKGRTPEHLRHLWLLEAVGLESTDDPVFEDGLLVRTVRRHTHGRALLATIGKAYWLDRADTILARLGLHADAVAKRAWSIAGAETADTIGSIAAGCVAKMVARDHQAREERRAEEQRLQRQYAATRRKIAADVLGRKHSSVDVELEASLRRAKNAEPGALKMMGISVVSTTDGFSVFHAPIAIDAKGNPKRKKGKLVRAAPSCKGMNFVSSELAWRFGATLVT